MVTTIVQPRSPEFVNINLEVTASVLPTFYAADVQKRVSDALTSVFEVNKLRFGQTFYLSKIYEVVQDTSGVDHASIEDFSAVDITGKALSSTAGTIELSPIQFPCQGTLSVTPQGGLR